jgi:hypothetical protein
MRRSSRSKTRLHALLVAHEDETWSFSSSLTVLDDPAHTVDL